MNRYELPDETPKPPPMKTETQMSPEAKAIQEHLVEQFADVLEERNHSPLDVMSGIIAFVSKATDLLTTGGMVPRNFPEILEFNMRLDFEFQKAREGYGEGVVPLIKEMVMQHFHGTLTQN